MSKKPAELYVHTHPIGFPEDGDPWEKLDHISTQAALFLKADPPPFDLNTDHGRIDRAVYHKRKQAALDIQDQAVIGMSALMGCDTDGAVNAALEVGRALATFNYWDAKVEQTRSDLGRRKAGRKTGQATSEKAAESATRKKRALTHNVRQVMRAFFADEVLKHPSATRGEIFRRMARQNNNKFGWTAREIQDMCAHYDPRKKSR